MLHSYINTISCTKLVIYERRGKKTVTQILLLMLYFNEYALTAAEETSNAPFLHQHHILCQICHKGTKVINSEKCFLETELLTNNQNRLITGDLVEQHVIKAKTSPAFLKQCWSFTYSAAHPSQGRLGDRLEELGTERGHTVNAPQFKRNRL
ncbi:hypothetical protein CEXT_297011 [Caerostris extrusa]|uniref:Uncharacterized protein n=1 Tax=Caerostris extrusa TaxID=172846 RepID=A0AAV4NUE4_CAEEX|nr:hypothetical protein CEXT_297011 [Caerostris extrusa]